MSLHFSHPTKRQRERERERKRGRTSKWTNTKTRMACVCHLLYAHSHTFESKHTHFLPKPHSQLNTHQYPNGVFFCQTHYQWLCWYGSILVYVCTCMYMYMHTIPSMDLLLTHTCMYTCTHAHMVPALGCHLGDGWDDNRVRLFSSHVRDSETLTKVTEDLPAFAPIANKRAAKNYLLSAY